MTIEIVCEVSSPTDFDVDIRCLETEATCLTFDGPSEISLAVHFNDFSDISVLIDELQRVLDEGLAYRKQQRRIE